MLILETINCPIAVKLGLFFSIEKELSFEISLYNLSSSPLSASGFHRTGMKAIRDLYTSKYLLLLITYSIHW